MTDKAEQIIARGPRVAAEAAARALDADPALEALTYSILEEDEANMLWRIDAFPTSDGEADVAAAVLAAFGALQMRREALIDADWLAMALSGLPPVRAGRFFIYGLHDRGRVPTNTVNLRIEAGAAFGTGHHGTTVGCLLAFDRLLKRRRFARVLDVGTGAGVLAIAAARCGARRVAGADIDPVSVRIARENAKVNGVRLQVLHASRPNGRAVSAAGPYDLVFANILPGPLAWLAPDIRRRTAPGGIVILSGLLRGQERFVRAAYRARGFRLLRSSAREAWVTLIMERRGGKSAQSPRN